MNPTGNAVSIIWRCAVTLSVLTSCAQADPGAEQVSTSAVSRAVPSGPGCAGNGPMGNIVHVTPQHKPAVGANRLAISVDPDSPSPQSVDLVSPDMPMHGVVRYPAERQGDAWIAEIDVPMSGRWVLYVNFDDGANAAAFPFTVVTVAVDSSDAHTAHHH